MAVQWFFQLNGQERGPLSGEQLRHLARTGRITAESLVRRGTEGEWVPARRVRGLFPTATGSSASPADASDNRPVQQAGSASSQEAGRPLRSARSGGGSQVIKRAKPLPSREPRREPEQPAPKSPRPSLSEKPPAPSPHDTVSDQYDTIEEPARPPAAKPPITSAPRPPVPPAVGVRPAPSSPEIPTASPEIPTGAPVPPPAAAEGLPTGIPVASAPPAPVGGPGMADAVLPTRSQRLLERRRQRKPWVLAGILGGVLLLTAAVGGIAWWMSRSQEATLADAGANATERGREPQGADPEFDPEMDVAQQEPAAGEDEPPAQASATRSRNAGNPAEGGATPVPAAVQESLGSIRSWADASRVRVRSGSMEVRVTAAWMESADIAEREGNLPPTEDQEDEPGRGDAEEAEAGGAEAGSPGDAGKRVYIQMTLRNGSADSIARYSSWNGTGMLGQDARAWLLTGEGGLLPMVPPEETAGRNRRAGVALEPGQSIEDWLVFQAPRGEPDDLRLVLPRAALGSTGYIGFELPKVMLISGNRPRTGPADGGVPNVAADGDGRAAGSERDGEVAGGGFAEPPADGDKPPREAMRTGGEPTSEDAGDDEPAVDPADALRQEFEEFKRSIEGGPGEEQEPGEEVDSSKPSPPASDRPD